MLPLPPPLPLPFPLLPLPLPVAPELPLSLFPLLPLPLPELVLPAEFPLLEPSLDAPAVVAAIVVLAEDELPAVTPLLVVTAVWPVLLDVVVPELPAGHIGGRAWVKLHLPAEPVGWQAVRTVRQLLLRQFSPTGQA